MAKLYAEVHAATIDETTEDAEKDKVRDLLRQARTLRFFDLFSKTVARNLKRKLTDFQNARGSRNVKKVVERMIQDLDFAFPKRLLKFCEHPYLWVLFACSHSTTFREAITRTDRDSVAANLPKWQDIETEIERFASSLELFARTQSFDWTASWTAPENDFNTLLKTVFRGLPAVQGKTGQQFGILDADLEGFHEIGEEQRDKVHHHWVVTDNNGQAVRPSITYTVTEELRAVGFHDSVKAHSIAQGAGTVNGRGRLRLGGQYVLEQFNILQSCILADFLWPNGKSDDDMYDPTFTGFKGNPCRVCNEDQASTSRDQASLSPACDCTFADLCARQKPPCDPTVLVEVFETPSTGRGVRALQNIRKGAFLGEYVGEIYPEFDVNNPGHYLSIYGDPEGTKYHFSMDLKYARDFNDDDDDDDDDDDSDSQPAAAAAADKKHYTIDAAHRGNWTRYMNHSCKSNTQFIPMYNLGGHSRVVVQARRKIVFGEEITADYGPDYFTPSGFNCNCGERGCKYRNVV